MIVQWLPLAPASFSLPEDTFEVYEGETIAIPLANVLHPSLLCSIIASLHDMVRRIHARLVFLSR